LNPTLFSSAEQSGFAKLIGETWLLNPLELDPPVHGQFRRILEPWFSPKWLAKMTAQVAERARLGVEGWQVRAGVSSSPNLRSSSRFQCSSISWHGRTKCSIDFGSGISH